MTTILVAFVAAFIASVLLTLLTIRVAPRFKLVDCPDGERKLHGGPMPRAGGIPVFLGFWFPVACLVLMPWLSQMSRILVGRTEQIAAILVGSAAVLALGLADDRWNMPARTKLVVEAVIALGMYLAGFRILNVTNPMGGGIGLGAWDLPVTLLWFLGCMNAVNLLDGIDGLAAGTAFFVSAVLFVVSISFDSAIGQITMACLGGAVLGFLVLNFPPARIFLGDSGSLTLGFLLASFSLIASKKAEAAVALFVPITAMGLPILDTSLAILRRWYRRLPISSPDREHIHHTLIAMGYSHRRAVLILYGLCVLFALAAVVMITARSEAVVFVIAILVITVYVCLRLFGRITLRDILFKLYVDDRRHHAVGGARLQAERAADALARAATPEECWETTRRLAERIGLSVVRIHLDDGRGCSMDREWLSYPEAAALPPRGADRWLMTVGLEHGGVAFGSFTVQSDSTHHVMDADLPFVLDYYRFHLAERLGQLCQTHTQRGSATA